MMGSSTSPQESKAYLYVCLVGLLKGYSMDNLVWICKQIRLETGGWSRGLIEGRNPFGLGCAKKRPNNQVGCIDNEDVGIGVYSSIWKAVQDRFAWDEYWKIEPGEGYPERVAAKYHLSDTYARSVASVSGVYMRNGLMRALASILLGTIVVKYILK